MQTCGKCQFWEYEPDVEFNLERLSNRRFGTCLICNRLKQVFEASDECKFAVTTSEYVIYHGSQD
jgi:hypothetical protein